jgi:hypothetical protein
MALEDDDPDVFVHFVDSIHGQGLTYHKKHEEDNWGHVFERCGLEVFTDKIGLSGLAADAAKKYQARIRIRELAHVEEIQFIYEHCSTTFQNIVTHDFLSVYLDTGF